MQHPSAGVISRYSAFWICLLAAIVCQAAYFAWYMAGFPGHPIHVFCEIDSGGFFRQDANSVSALLFVYIGLAIAWRAGRRKAENLPAPPNPMTRSDFYPGVYALATIILGYGTVAMHGSLTSFGGFLDVSSMYIWVAFCVCYALIRIVRRGPILFLILYAALSAYLIQSTWRGRLPVEEAFGGLILLAVMLELAYRIINRKRVRFENRWVLYTGISFFTAFGIWNLSLRGRPFYYPDTLLQGHAVWHILCAVATWTIYRYYRSEQPADAA
jgi:hypothetical protein